MPDALEGALAGLTETTGRPMPKNSALVTVRVSLFHNGVSGRFFITIIG